MRRWFVLLCLLVIGGCGYRAVTEKGLYRDDVRTVAVTAAASGEDTLELPADVTAAIVRQIEARTPYRLADAATADSLLEVEIRSTRVNVDRRSRTTGLPERAGLEIYGDATWTDLRTGRPLLELEDVRGEAEQFPTLGEGNPTPRRAAAEDFAERLVDDLAGRW